MTFMNHIYTRCSGNLDLVKYLLRWSDFENEIVTFPLWAVNGQLVGYQQYNWNADKLKNNDCKGKYWTYRRKDMLTAWGLEFINLSSQQPLYLVEGVWDAVSVIGTTRDCLAVLSNNPQQIKPWLSALPRKIVAVCDGDNAGKMLASVCDDYIVLPKGMDANSIEKDFLDNILTEFEHNAEKIYK